MKTEMRLKEVVQNWQSSFFDKLYAIKGQVLPWKVNSTISSVSLDLLYMGDHSGNKIISPLVESLIESHPESDILSDQDMSILIEVIWGIYEIKWRKEYATITLTYNPIDNYSMTETEKNTGTENRDATNTGTETREGTNTGTENRTLEDTNIETGNDVTEDGTDFGKTVTTTVTGTATTNRNVFGYNSSVAVPSDNETGNTTSENTEGWSGTDSSHRNLKHDLTITKTGTDNLTLNTKDTDNLTVDRRNTDNLTIDRTRTLERAGNIGVTTTQTMIEQEREIWQWNYFNMVFTDMDSVLTIQNYGGV